MSGGFGTISSGVQIGTLQSIMRNRDDTGFVGRDIRPVNVKDFGAVGNNGVDDTGAIQAAIDAVHAAGGGVVLADGRYDIMSDLVVYPNVTLDLGDRSPGEKVYWNANEISWSSTNALLLADGASIVVHAHGAVINGYILNRDIAALLPFGSEQEALDGVAAYAGIAITTASDVPCGDVLVENLFIGGFEYAVRPDSSQNNERWSCRRIKIDCTNGLRFANGWAIDHFYECDCWNYLTAHYSWSTASTSQRSGVAYWLDNVGSDWGKLTNCFSFGYYRGFYLSDTNDLTLLGCGADGGYSGSAGYEIAGTAYRTKLISCQAGGQGTGLIVNSSDATRTNYAIGFTTWGNTSLDIALLKGTLRMSDSGLSGCTGSYNINVVDNNARLFVDSTDIGGATSTVVNIENSGHENVHIDPSCTLFEGINVYNGYYPTIPTIDAADTIEFPINQPDVNIASTGTTISVSIPYWCN